METTACGVFSEKNIWKRNITDITGISAVGVMLTRHLFKLCENPHPHTYVDTHVLTTTSPVTGSLIKLTGAGLSGQAKTSEPSPSCHDMMDLSTTGCQAATQVHLPVAVHQETLAKHPVDQLICISTITFHSQVWLHVQEKIKISSFRKFFPCPHCQHVHQSICMNGKL